MREAYETQLAQIDIALVAMADLVGTAIRGATDALLADDLAIAELVIAGDTEINKLNADVEEISMLIAALQAPMATDLRLVMGAIRMSGSLERMGDLAVHIAKQVRLRYPNPSIPAELSDTFEKMGQAASKIVEQAGEVIATRNTGLADDMKKYDDILDDLHRELFSVVLSPDWAHGVEAAIDVTLLSRFYERFGDHAVSVARRVIQIVTGEPYAK
ncbi:MAG: phosphate signaling complex protein PhoU [Candidatus Nanopelagicales bacterium]|jgi:phosphate transport system protein|nr:phosphate signaling complex protein PhoU [Candidatus Nanopelagicales bacterium]MDP4895627.1 phosphate signaling complex protein PhoU [Candidatus Nanopelagicales bacterium]MDP5050690.1 phosphate signaling complex protein PhoU [Candidatus Nanopelagicales bacterium]